MQKSYQNIIYTTLVQTPLGKMLAASTSGKIILLCTYDEPYIKKQLEYLQKLYKANIVEQVCESLLELEQELDEYFEGKRKDFSVTIELNGTLFEQECYKALLKIPYGETISYKEEAQMLGRVNAHRAVANANGRNRLEILIPCHRVIQSNGKLGGYSGGVQKKIFLLDLEKNMR